jgi:hypothetical protein
VPDLNSTRDESSLKCSTFQDATENTLRTADTSVGREAIADAVAAA